MAPVVAAAAVAGAAQLIGGLFGQAAAKKQRKEEALQAGVNQGFATQAQAAQNMAQGQQNAFAQLMQSYQNILR